MLSSKKNTNFLAIILLLLLGFIWGTGYSIARFAMTNGVPPLGYSLWQSVGPAILIGLLTYGTKQNLKISVSHVRYYLICGLTGIAIPNTIMYFAASHLPAGLLAVIVNTVPIMAYPLTLLARLERFNWLRFIGLIFAITGLMLIIFPQASLPSPQMIPWILITLITPFSFAFCSVYIARYRPEKSDSLSLAAGTLIFSSLLLMPLVLLKNNFYALHLPLTAPDWVILLEIILSSMGYVILFQLIKIAGPVYYSMVNAIVIITGLFWGYIIFHEQLNSWTGAAVILILMALILVTKRQQDVVKYLTPA